MLKMRTHKTRTKTCFTKTIKSALHYTGIHFLSWKMAFRLCRLATRAFALDVMALCFSMSAFRTSLRRPLMAAILFSSSFSLSPLSFARVFLYPAFTSLHSGKGCLSYKINIRHRRQLNSDIC